MEWYKGIYLQMRMFFRGPSTGGRVPSDSVFEPMGASSVHRMGGVGDSSRAMIDTIGELLLSWDAPWPLYRCNLSQVAILAAAIQNNDAWACADGSYMPNLSTLLATAAWRIEPKSTRTFVCRGETPVSGISTEINPYRAELTGIHAVLMAIKATCTFYDITEGSIDIFCDCDNVILQANR